jgi:hypothetical protein
MATFVYRRDRSDSARDLADALGATRYRALQLPIERKVRQGDVVIAWGEAVPAVPGVTILNGAPIQNKYRDALKLREAGIATIEVSQTKPAPVPTTDPAIALFTEAQEVAEDFCGLFELNPATLRNNRVALDGINQLQQVLTNLRQSLGQPIPTRDNGEWLARRNNHVGGDDLLTPLQQGDYYSKKEDIVEEFRIHSFKGKSIRAGKKVPRTEGFVGTPHPWIRSWDGGWRIIYNDIEGTRGLRDLAHAAVAALGLDFGAVDIGQKRDGSLLVLEVNRAPGLGEGTAEKYADAIRRYLANPTEWTQQRRRAA